MKFRYKLLLALIAANVVFWFGVWCGTTYEKGENAFALINQRIYDTQECTDLIREHIGKPRDWTVKELK